MPFHRELRSGIYGCRTVLPLPLFIEHELAFHMPDDEGKTQDDENNDFPVWPFSIGVPPTMEMTTTRMGWNMFAF